MNLVNLKLLKNMIKTANLISCFLYFLERLTFDKKKDKIISEVEKHIKTSYKKLKK